MARNNSLQVASYTQIISGGYGRGTNGVPLNLPADQIEELDGSTGVVGGPGSFNDADDNGSLTRTYTWRDSDVGMNSQSGRGVVEIRDEWTSTVDDSNNLVIDLRSTVVRCWRDDIRGARAKGARQIAVLNSAGTQVLHTFPAVNNIGSFNNAGDPWYANVTQIVHIVLPPQQESAQYAPSRVKNWSLNTGVNVWTPGPNTYIDEMRMGAIFKNNLPNQFDPPKLINIDQTARICDNVVDATFHFEHPNLNGAKLLLQWRYEGQDWSDTRQNTVTGKRSDEQVDIIARDLIPTTCEPTKVYWRARWQPTISTLQPSEWTYGEFYTIFVPPVWMNVPDITVEECNAVGKGDLLDEYEEVVYYNGQKPECKEGSC